MCSQKRKAADDTDEDFQLPNGMPLPLWVSCIHSLNLYQEGVLLPDELKLSKAAARQVRRIREWAAQKHGLSLPGPSQLVQPYSRTPTVQLYSCTLITLHGSNAVGPTQPAVECPCAM